MKLKHTDSGKVKYQSGWKVVEMFMGKYYYLYLGNGGFCALNS